MTTEDIQKLELEYKEYRRLADEAIDKYHRLNGDFAKNIAKKNRPELFDAIETVNEELAKAGIHIVVNDWCSIDKGSEELKVRIVVFPQRIDDTEEFVTLNDEDKSALAQNDAIAKASYQEYKTNDDLASKTLTKIGEANREAYKSMDKAAILELVKSTHDSHEEYYCHFGPQKRKQEDFVGVQVVKMNVDLLEGWFDERLANLDDYTNLPTADRREIWEASGFHFGIMGYKDEDADYYWSHLA